MLNLKEIIETHKDNVQDIFNKFGIKAEVNEKNLQNAISGIPSVRNAMLNTFEGFEGNKEGKDDDFEIEYDAVTGEEKKVKRKKILKDVFGFAKDTASNYIKTKQIQNEQPTEQPTEKTESKKEAKKVFGMPVALFVSICVILFLVILALILKAKK